MLKSDILIGDICANDQKLKESLGDPNATTAKILLKYIESEE